MAADGLRGLPTLERACREEPRLRDWFRTPPAQPQLAFSDLSARERQILKHLAAGLSNTEIGARLNLTAKTVANNVSSILNKLQVTQRNQAIVRAREAGMGLPREEAK